MQAPWLYPKFLMAVMLVIGTVATRAGTISLVHLPATGTDAASEINTNGIYLCALAFGSDTDPLSINGVDFERLNLVGKGTGADYQTPLFSGTDANYGGTWTLSGLYSGNVGFRSGNGLHRQADGSIGTMLNEFTFLDVIPGVVGTTVTLDCGGLIPGERYSLRYYYRQWSLAGVFPRRPAEVTFNGEGTNHPYAFNPFDLDAGGAHYLRYDFTAASTHVTMQLVATRAGGPHIHGVTLQAASALDPRYGVGSWIWAPETRDQQTCRFWKSFEIPMSATVERARLRITADNSYRVFLDGREVGRGAEWRNLAEVDLTLLLGPGPHVLAVEAFNDLNEAGVVLGLNVLLTDGRLREIGSDSSWRVVPNGEGGWMKRMRASPAWPAAKVVAPLRTAPWKAGFAIYTRPQLQALVVSFWQRGWFQVTLASFCLLAVAICLYLAGRLVMQSQAQSVVARERARIARDIHDDLTAGLTQLVLLRETTQSELPAQSETRSHLNEICGRARRLLRSLNETIWVVNSQRDTLRDFASYVCKYAETFLQPTPIRCRFEVEPDLPPLPCHVGIRRNLFLAVKEALSNALKHSQATELFVRIHRQGRQVVVCVEDNGRGFDPAAADRERNGLSNMSQRAAEAGGECSVSSTPGAGCRVQFKVPLTRPHGHAPKWLARKRGRNPIGLDGPLAARPSTIAPANDSSESKTA